MGVVMHVGNSAGNKMVCLMELLTVSDQKPVFATEDKMLFQRISNEFCQYEMDNIVSPAVPLPPFLMKIMM